MARCAALARYVLAAYLGTQSKARTLDDYLADEVEYRLRDVPVPGAFTLLRVALRNLGCGELGQTTSLLNRGALIAISPALGRVRFPPTWITSSKAIRSRCAYPVRYLVDRRRRFA